MEIIFLKDFSNEVSSQGSKIYIFKNNSANIFKEGFSLLKNESMFDSMLMERA